MQYWRAALKWGLGSLGLFLVGCFVYGLFNAFSFLHGSSPAGMESGFGYAMIFGAVIGPFVLLGGALAGAAAAWWRKHHP